MKGKDGFVQAYNGQLAVDTKAQIIVACDLTDEAVDAGRLVPLLDRIEHHLGQRPKEVSADVGYCSEANLQALGERSIKGYVATGRQKHPATGEDRRRGPLVRAMRQKLKRGGRRSRYRLRKQTVEPVIGRSSRPAASARSCSGSRQGSGRMGADLHRPQPSSC